MAQASGTRSAYDKALGFLARREYSCVELGRRLEKAGFAEAEISQAMTQLQANHYQSDARFTDMLVRSRINQGHGEVRLRYELGQHQIDNNLIEKALAEAEVDWVNVAAHQLRRHFGTHLPDSFNARGKCMQYLARRGFPTDAIKQAMHAWAHEVNAECHDAKD